MTRQLMVLVFIGLLLAGCEKLPSPETPSLNVRFEDLHGKPILDLYGGLQVKLVSDEFKKFTQQQIDLKKEGVLMFDKIIAPIDSVGADFIITRVPLMYYIDPLLLPITIRIGNQSIPLCNSCLPYRPTVRGEILTGFVEGAPDGTFLMPAEMAIDGFRNIYVIDQRGIHNLVLKVTPTGEVSTFAGAADEFGRLVGIGINATTNKMYLSDATAQRIFELNISSPSTITTLAGSGVAGNVDGTGTAASFHFGNNRVDNTSTSEDGQGLALDAAGNIYVGEQVDGLSRGSQIRKITPAGVVTSVPGSRYWAASAAGDASMPAGLVLSPSNEIWYAGGASTMFQGVTRVNTDGSSLRVAGQVSMEGMSDGTGVGAQFTTPKAIATNGTYFFVADGMNGALRRVSTAGQVITLAGVGERGTSSRNGGGIPPLEGFWLMPNPFLVIPRDYYQRAAAVIRMDQVGGIVVTNSGRLIYIADYGYKCIWKITIE